MVVIERKIKLLRDKGFHKRGDVLTLPKGQAISLVKCDVAKFVYETKSKEPVSTQVVSKVLRARSRK